MVSPFVADGLSETSDLETASSRYPTNKKFYPTTAKFPSLTTHTPVRTLGVATASDIIPTLSTCDEYSKNPAATFPGFKNRKHRTFHVIHSESNVKYLSVVLSCRAIRETDRVPDLAAQRYEVYKESKPALLALSDVMPVITIDASGHINEVRHAVGTALSTHERSWNLQDASDDDPNQFKSFA